MKVVLYGATGKAGSRILTELLSRGHQVTAVVRNPQKASLPAQVQVEQGNLANVEEIAKQVKGADVVISAYGPPLDATEKLLDVTKLLLEALQKGGNPRFLMVGGAASLEVAPGVSLLDSGHLPAQWIPIGTAHRDALNLLKSSNLNWTYFSPAGFFEPGESTGKFRLGTNQLIATEAGESRISMEDYAIALVDELEKPQHKLQRFTIGY